MNQDIFQHHIETFEKFVNNVFSGCDRTQKSLLLEKCQNFVRIGEESKKRFLKDAKTIPKGKQSKNRVPDEIWLKIIGFLETKDVFGNFAVVCKRFNSLTLQPTAIKKLSINYKNIKSKSFLNVLNIKAMFRNNNSYTF